MRKSLADGDTVSAYADVAKPMGRRKAKEPVVCDVLRQVSRSMPFLPQAL